MSTTFMSVNIINVRKYRIRNFRGVLQSDLESDVIHFAF